MVGWSSTWNWRELAHKNDSVGWTRWISIYLRVSTRCPIFSSIFPFKTTGGWFTSYHFFTQLVWSSISPNKYVISSFHHSTTYFSWWTSRLVLRPPGPSSMTKPPRPMSCRRKLRPVVPGWMVAVGFHYPSGMIIIHSPYRGIPNHQAAILDSRDAWSI